MLLSPYTAYFLGIITVLVPIVIFYVLGLNFNSVNNAWQSFFCT